MNLSEIFIKRPVTTTLVMLGIMVFGTMAYRSLPVSDLPAVDFPTIQVNASLPGASPETMASTVALPLEKQFAGIAGLSNINSTSQQGTTNITLNYIDSGTNLSALTGRGGASYLKMEKNCEKGKLSIRTGSGT